MLGIKESGLKVSEDIMITGADNIEMAEYLSTPLTTFDNQSSECGRIDVLDYIVTSNHVHLLLTAKQFQKGSGICTEESNGTTNNSRAPDRFGAAVFIPLSFRTVAISENASFA
jgi:hypothetical protein